MTQGRTLSTFGAEVLGILRDGVGRGAASSSSRPLRPVVTAAGGLWAGASGSPVFLRTGSGESLAGAIAYGLAGGGSTLAGLTPAEDMEQLLDIESASVPTTVKVPRAARGAHGDRLRALRHQTATISPEAAFRRRG